MVHVAKDCRQLSSVVRQNITPVETDVTIYSLQLWRNIHANILSEVI